MNLKQNLRKVIKALAPVHGVRAVVLYGSFARGDYGPKSDLDLFIITDRPERREAILEALAELELDRRIQPTVRSDTELKATDSGLLQNVFEEGKLVYLREPLDLPAEKLLRLKPHSIFTFGMTGLDQRMKARFNREMYERTTGKYKYSGLLGEMGGQRLSSGCVMVPLAARGALVRLFKRSRIEFKEIVVWR